MLKYYGDVPVVKYWLASIAPGQQSSRRLGDELREQRARLLAGAALLEADVGALLAPAVDAVPPAARARLRDLDEG